LQQRRGCTINIDYKRIDKMTTNTTHMPTATDVANLLLARTAFKDIDLALGEELQKAALAAAPPITTSTLPDLDERTPPLDAVVVSPRVAEEMTQDEVMQAVKEVLGFSFPKPSGPNDISVFSGYIFVNGKQVTWTRHIGNRKGGRITLSLREDKDMLLSSCLDDKTVFACQ
jgi:hypothetical protein